MFYSPSAFGSSPRREQKCYSKFSPLLGGVSRSDEGVVLNTYIFFIRISLTMSNLFLINYSDFLTFLKIQFWTNKKSLAFLKIFITMIALWFFTPYSNKHDNERFSWTKKCSSKHRKAIRKMSRNQNVRPFNIRISKHFPQWIIYTRFNIMMRLSRRTCSRNLWTII